VYCFAPSPPPLPPAAPAWLLPGCAANFSSSLTRRGAALINRRRDANGDVAAANRTGGGRAGRESTRPPAYLTSVDGRSFTRAPQFTLFRPRAQNSGTYAACNSASSNVEQTYRRTFRPGGQTARGNRGGLANVYMYTDTHTRARARVRVRVRASAIPRAAYLFRVI